MTRAWVTAWGPVVSTQPVKSTSRLSNPGRVKAGRRTSRNSSNVRSRSWATVAPGDSLVEKRTIWQVTGPVHFFGPQNGETRVGEVDQAPGAGLGALQRAEGRGVRAAQAGADVLLEQELVHALPAGGVRPGDRAGGGAPAAGAAWRRQPDCRGGVAWLRRLLQAPRRRGGERAGEGTGGRQEALAARTARRGRGPGAQRPEQPAADPRQR